MTSPCPPSRRAPRPRRLPVGLVLLSLLSGAAAAAAQETPPDPAAEPPAAAAGDARAQDGAQDGAGGGSAPVEVKLPMSDVREAEVLVEEGSFTTEELYDGLVAPIALYPDILLTPVLGAVRQPEKIASLAEQLSGANGGAVLPEDEGVSFAPLVHVPEVLDLLAYNMEWTEILGKAMEHRRTEVMAAIQRVRHGAMAAGHLHTDEVLTVRDQRGNVTVDLTDDTVLRVPRYEPSLVLEPLDPGEPPLVEYGPEITFPRYRTVRAGLRAADATARLRELPPTPAGSASPAGAPLGYRNYGPRRNLGVGMLLFRDGRGGPMRRVGRLMAINAFGW